MDDECAAVLCLRGGYGTTRILDLIDYDLIRRNAKLFIGFSDITALHTVFRQACDMAVIHGPMALSLGRKSSDFTREGFKDKSVEEADINRKNRRAATLGGRAGLRTTGGRESDASFRYVRYALCLQRR